MTQSAFQLLQKMDQKDIQLQLALQCAPLILGLKVSNLLIIPVQHRPLVMDILKNTDISADILICSDRKVTFLLYRKEPLQRYLNREEISGFLLHAGYSSSKIAGVLPIFCGRYLNYMRHLQTFPHEMGILLGYPLEDVKGFIQNNGRQFLYTGYWKVYENLPEKMQLFHRYEQATEHLLGRIAAGEQIADIIRISPYKSAS